MLPNQMVNQMRIDKPKYVYVISKEDVRPIGRHIKKDFPKSKISLIRTLPSFVEEEKERKGD